MSSINQPIFDVATNLGMQLHSLSSVNYMRNIRIVIIFAVILSSIECNSKREIGHGFLHPQYNCQNGIDFSINARPPLELNFPTRVGPYINVNTNKHIQVCLTLFIGLPTTCILDTSHKYTNLSSNTLNSLYADASNYPLHLVVQLHCKTQRFRITCCSVNTVETLYNTDRFLLKYSQKTFHSSPVG